VDLQLYLRVIWRFKLLLAVGFVVAVGLATFSIYRVSPGGKPMISYRKSATWQAKEVLLVTQPGFPWGSSSFRPNSDPAKYSQLATIYVQLVMSDPVRQLIAKQWPVSSQDLITAFPVLAQSYNLNSPPLPLISVEVTSTTSGRATELARQTTLAFKRYLDREQAKNLIPREQRVVVTVVRSHDAPLLVEGHSKTLPLVVFVAVLMGFVGLALVLENLRPRVRPVPSAVEAADVRRSA
jgi:hypothetical protein